MSGPIFFNVREARERLLSHGEVVTLRKRRGTGRTVAYVGSRFNRTRLCAVVVEFVAPFRRDTDGIRQYTFLEGNLEGSGFDTIDKWLSAAAEDANVLYRVRRTGP